MNIQKGLSGLLQSRKGTLSLIILVCITALCAWGRMDGTSFAACCTVISGIFCFTQSQTDRQAMRMDGANQLIAGVNTGQIIAGVNAAQAAVSDAAAVAVSNAQDVAVAKAHDEPSE